MNVNQGEVYTTNITTYWTILQQLLTKQIPPNVQLKSICYLHVTPINFHR